MTDDRRALLVLEDGSHAFGRPFGAEGTSFGEAVFNTGMTGYQEVLTDPSYHRQIVVMTGAHVGNYGVNDNDAESDRVQVAGFVVREAARRSSSWRADGDLATALRESGTVAVDGIDTRWLTRRLRDVGAMRAGVSTEVLDVDELHAQVLASPTMEGLELASAVTTPEPYTVDAEADQRFRVVVLDYGMKRSIVRRLQAIGARVTVLPAHSDADQVLSHEPDGVMVSNGPGDPSVVTQGITTVRELLGRVPVFGICLGSQLLGHAIGGATYKLMFGHHGANQPVMDATTATIEITSHNHGFAVDPDTLGEPVDNDVYSTSDHGLVRVTHRNLNDNVCEGLALHDFPAFSVQYHPEAAPGPSDARHLFDRFAALMTAHARGSGRVDVTTGGAA